MFCLEVMLLQVIKSICRAETVKKLAFSVRSAVLTHVAIGFCEEQSACSTTFSVRYTHIWGQCLRLHSQMRFSGYCSQLLEFFYLFFAFYGDRRTTFEDFPSVEYFSRKYTAIYQWQYELLVFSTRGQKSLQVKVSLVQIDLCKDYTLRQGLNFLVAMKMFIFFFQRSRS